MFVEEEPSGADVANIAVRLPHGARIQRKFVKSAKVQMLYDYVDAFGNLEIAKYELCTSFPKKLLDRRNITIGECFALRHDCFDAFFGLVVVSVFSLFSFLHFEIVKTRRGVKCGCF